MSVDWRVTLVGDFSFLESIVGELFPDDGTCVIGFVGSLFCLATLGGSVALLLCLFVL